MTEILTQEQVTHIRAHPWFETEIRDLCDSHRTLVEQLAEAQADVRALANAIQSHLKTYGLDTLSAQAIMSALARPGVKRVMEEQHD